MPHSILLVDDDPVLIQVMGRMLEGLAAIRFAMDGASALKQMRVMAPDLVLLDAEMPGMNGYAVCEEMQRDPELAHIPVVFVTGHGGVDREVKSLNIGAVDFIVKPFSEALLRARAQTQLRIKHLSDELRAIATIDALTNVQNRRSFDDALDREWRRASRSQSGIALLMLDVDEFKRYNDTHGHPAGDACLRQVAAALRSEAQRPGDVVARYGGEEFAVLLPDTPLPGAQFMATRILEAVKALKIPHGGSRTSCHVSISIGVAAYGAGRSPGSSWDRSAPLPAAEMLVQAADQCLYRAKAGGRDQVWACQVQTDGSQTDIAAVRSLERARCAV